MDRQLFLDHQEQAERRVALANDYIARQIELIEQLAAHIAGRDGSNSRQISNCVTTREQVYLRRVGLSRTLLDSLPPLRGPDGTRYRRRLCGQDP